MLPHSFSAADPEADRARYKIVRRDTMADVPGLILSASVETGLCLLRLDPPQGKGDAQEFNFGPHGLSIVMKGR